MDDKYTDNYHKGSVLMQSALKKYANGDYKGGDKDRREANKYYDSAELEVNHDMINRMNSLYGESLNFGVIYKVIEENTDNLYTDEKKRKSFKPIIKLLREDKVLNTQFKLYDALRNPKDVENVSTYVDEAFNLAKSSLNEKKIKDSNKKLLDAVHKANLFEYVDINDDEMDLYENVEYVLLNNVTFQSLNDYSAAKAKVRGYVTEHNVSGEKATASVPGYIDKCVSVTEKYSRGLTDDEYKLISEIYESLDKKSLFEKKKYEAINTLHEYVKTSTDADKEEVAMIIEKLNAKEFNEKTLLSDIAELVEITQIIND